MVRLLGGCLLALAGVLAFLAVRSGHAGLLVWAVTALCLGGVSLTLGILTRRGPRDALAKRRQQRLWRSGPLGRLWLRSRGRRL